MELKINIGDEIIVGDVFNLEKIKEFLPSLNSYYNINGNTFIVYVGKPKKIIDYAVKIIKLAWELNTELNVFILMRLKEVKTLIKIKLNELKKYIEFYNEINYLLEALFVLKENNFFTNIDEYVFKTLKGFNHTIGGIKHFKIENVNFSKTGYLENVLYSYTGLLTFDLESSVDDNNTIIKLVCSKLKKLCSHFSKLFTIRCCKKK